MRSSLLVVARTAPASEDGVQFGGVENCRVLTVREAPESPRAVEKARRRQSTPSLANDNRGDEGLAVRRVFLHQALQRFRDLMDRVRRHEVQRLGEGPIGDRRRLAGDYLKVRPDAQDECVGGRRDDIRRRGCHDAPRAISSRLS